jgi:hypothetical protein
MANKVMVNKVVTINHKDIIKIIRIKNHIKINNFSN